MTVTLTKDIRIAGVSHKKGDQLEVSESTANLLADCSGGKAKKKAGKKEASTSDG